MLDGWNEGMGEGQVGQGLGMSQRPLSLQLITFVRQLDWYSRIVLGYLWAGGHQRAAQNK